MPTSKPHTGAAVVLPLASRLAAQLALPGGEPADDLHVTLAYLGDNDALDAETRAALRAALVSVAREAPMVVATLGGVGRFSGPEADALYLSVDAPALAELRALVLAAVKNAGAVVDTTHGFTPHLTLAYLAHDDATPYDRAEPVRVSFDRLALWLGDDRSAWPLAAPAGEQLSARVGTVTLDALALPADFPPTQIKLFARGWNETTKGRFLLDEQACASVLAAFRAHGVDLAIDFDHGSFGEPGQKRDTAGWICGLEARDDGLYATGVKWTAKGLAAIAPGKAPDGAETLPEYRYHSPSIQFDKATRRIEALQPLALVTFPASVGQPPLVLTATTTTAREVSARTEPPMSKPRIAMLTALCLAATASDEEITAAVDELKGSRDALSKAVDRVADALGVAPGGEQMSDAATVEEKTAEVMAALDALKKSSADAVATSEKSERAALIAKGREKGQLNASLEKLYAKKPVADLREFLDAAPRIIPLENHAPPSKGAAQLSYGGKAFEQLSTNEQARLSQEQPELFAAMLEDAESRGV